jgi:hypothetical protein
MTVAPAPPTGPRSAPEIPETLQKRRKHRTRRYWRRWLALALAVALGFEYAAQNLPYVVRILNWILSLVHMQLIFAPQLYLWQLPLPWLHFM